MQEAGGKMQNLPPASRFLPLASFLFRRSFLIGAGFDQHRDNFVE